MKELLIFAICLAVLALSLLIRVGKGPSVVDRVVAADSIDILMDAVLIIYSMYSGRTIFLDIALITALLGFISTTLISRYLEGRL